MEGNIIASRRKQKDEKKKKQKVVCSACGTRLSHIVSRSIGKCREHRSVEDMQDYLKDKEMRKGEKKNG